MRLRCWAATLLGLSACAEPTLLVLELSSDVACPPESQSSLAITASLEGPEAAEASSLAVVPQSVGRCGQGTYHLAPGPEGLGKVVSLRVALALEGEASTRCFPGPQEDLRGCVVARRTARFVQGRAVAVPVRLEAACLNRACGPGSSCGPERLCRQVQEAADGDAGSWAGPALAVQPQDRSERLRFSLVELGPLGELPVAGVHVRVVDPGGDVEAVSDDAGVVDAWRHRRPDDVPRPLQVTAAAPGTGAVTWITGRAFLPPVLRLDRPVDERRAPLLVTELPPPPLVDDAGVPFTPQTPPGTLDERSSLGALGTADTLEVDAAWTSRLPLPFLTRRVVQGPGLTLVGWRLTSVLVTRSPLPPNEPVGLVGGTALDAGAVRALEVALPVTPVPDGGCELAAYHLVEPRLTLDATGLTTGRLPLPPGAAGPVRLEVPMQPATTLLVLRCSAGGSRRYWSAAPAGDRVDFTPLSAPLVRVEGMPGLPPALVESVGAPGADEGLAVGLELASGERWDIYTEPGSGLPVTGLQLPSAVRGLPAFQARVLRRTAGVLRYLEPARGPWELPRPGAWAGHRTTLGEGRRRVLPQTRAVTGAAVLEE